MRESMTARVFKRVALACYALFVAIPLYVVLVTSLNPNGQSTSSFIPDGISLAPFRDAFDSIPLARYLVNSLIVSLASTAFSLAIAVLASYAVTRLQFRGRNLFRGTILATQMLPGILFLLPLLIIYLNITRIFGIQLFGTLGGLILTYLTFALPFAVWMMSSFFETIPRELDEAGLMDGLTRLQVLWHIILPLSRPGLAAVGFFAFLTAWSEVLFAAGLSTADTRTIGLGLQSYATQYSVQWNQMMAASLIASLPVVVGFLLVQRQFVAGISAGAVKG
jgi:multiple sugar transport system permease protein